MSRFYYMTPVKNSFKTMQILWTPRQCLSNGVCTNQHATTYVLLVFLQKYTHTQTQTQTFRNVGEFLRQLQLPGATFEKPY